MNVIITLAGKSQRFREAGFSKPKFLIEIDGTPMVEHVVNMFDYTDTFHFVINNDQLNAGMYFSHSLLRNHITPLTFSSGSTCPHPTCM